MIANFFADNGGQNMWSIYFKEYDAKGNLVELISHRSKTISVQKRRINDFLKACKVGNVREVQFWRNNKSKPSLVSNGKSILFAPPIVAKLPLFDFCERCGVEV